MIKSLSTMLVLGVFDLAAAYACLRAARDNSAAWLLGALGLFVVICLIYTKSLQYAELAPVTFGWIVIVQLGVFALAARAPGASITPAHWAGVASILAGQAVLLFVPFNSPAP